MKEALFEVVRYPVPAQDDGRMIRDIIRLRLDLSRRLIRQVLGAAGLSVNGQPAFMGNRVRTGDVIRLCAPKIGSEDILPEEMPLDIYYEDEDLLIVSKPAGMVVHPTHGHYTGTLANAVIHHWLAKGETVRFRPLHRIDQDTSGLLAIAKSHFASQKMSRNLKHFLHARNYLAIVEGIFTSRNCVIDAPIDRKEPGSFLRAVLPDGKHAVTHVRLVENGLDTSLLSLRLETGRTHQIRVHMAYLHHPLVSDLFYGRPVEGLGRQALHAASLQVIHPRTHEVLLFEQPLPQDMANFWQRARKERVLFERKSDPDLQQSCSLPGDTYD